MHFRIFFLSLLAGAALHGVGFEAPWGKESDLKFSSPIPQHRQTLTDLGRLMEQLILFHQKVLTHVDGPRSHFKPCSSTYMLRAIRKYGFFKGYVMGCDRLLRENDDPWVYRTALTGDVLWKIDPP